MQWKHLETFHRLSLYTIDTIYEVIRELSSTASVG